MFFWPFFWWTIFLAPPGTKPPMDYFAVLDVDPYATIKEVRTAYWNKAKLYHPDIHPGNEEKLKAVIVAYDYIRENYTTIPRPPRKPVQADLWRGVSIYRNIISGAPRHLLQLPNDVFYTDVMIYCMIIPQGDEFRFKLPQGTTFPVNVNVRFKGKDYAILLEPEYREYA